MTYVARFALFLLLGAIVACSKSAEADITVRVVSDVVAGEEATNALTLLTNENGSGAQSPVSHALLSTDVLARGVTVAEFSRVPHGSYRIRIALQRASGVVLVERPIIFAVHHDATITVHLTANCEGVVCGEGVDACLDGRCVDPHCDPSNAEGQAYCPADLGCTSNEQCTGTQSECSQEECVQGLCVAVPTQDACAANQYCARELGCVDVAVSMDAGVELDASVDAFDSSTVVDTGVDVPDALDASIAADMAPITCPLGSVLFEGACAPQWTHYAYVKASNTDTEDHFGNSVAMSGDGNRFAIGACAESSSTTGVGGDPTDNSALHAGAVYVFVRAGDTWMQEAYVKASNTEADDCFGDSVSLSADGSRLAVGASREASSATGVGGDQSDNSAVYAGAVYVFSRSGSTWSQEAYLKASNAGTFDEFGHRVSLSADGDRLAVSATGEGSSATGIGGDQDDDDARNSGAVYVFARASGAWTQEAYIKASNAAAGNSFGAAIALSSDGARLAVGAPYENSDATGIDGDQHNLSAISSGAVYVFARSATTWSQEAYVKASNTNAEDTFGGTVSLSSDGSRLAVGAQNEASNAQGVGGNQADNSAMYAGAVYVFVRAGSTWSQEAYIKGSNTGRNDRFGTCVSLSSDGSRLAVGAIGEASNARGVGGNELSNGAGKSGAAYTFTRTGSTWTQQAYIKASNTEENDGFSTFLSLSSGGTQLVISAPNEDSAAINIDGDQADNSAPSSGAVYVLQISE